MRKLVTFISLACLVLFTVIFVRYRFNHNISNEYFFDLETTNVEYEGYIVPLSGNEIRQKVQLNISLLENFNDGDLFILKLDPLDIEDPWDQMLLQCQTLGYFYVTSDKIYRYSLPYDKYYSSEDNQKVINNLKNEPNDFLNNCDIVFTEEGSNDVLDEDNYHKYVEVNGEKRIYHFYNEDVSGTKYYEEIVWEKNKGITYYKSGSGSKKMHIEFGVKDVNNPFFFNNGEQKLNYNARFTFAGLDFPEEIEVLVTEVLSYENGIMYELKIDYDEDFNGRHYDGWDRLHLGYFYVQKDKIYLIQDQNEFENIKIEADIINNGVVVCQEEEKKDILKEDESGWHEYIVVNDNRREYHSYNSLTETGFYKTIIWEEGKGLVEYKCGFGAEKDDIELSLKD